MASITAHIDAWRSDLCRALDKGIKLQDNVAPYY